MLQFFDANTAYHAVTLTFDPLTLNVCGRSGVTWSLSVVSLIEIQQALAELFKIQQILAPITSCYDLDL